MQLNWVTFYSWRWIIRKTIWITSFKSINDLFPWIHTRWNLGRNTEVSPRGKITSNPFRPGKGYDKLALHTITRNFDATLFWGFEIFSEISPTTGIGPDTLVKVTVVGWISTLGNCMRKRFSGNKVIPAPVSSSKLIIWSLTASKTNKGWGGLANKVLFWTEGKDLQSVSLRAVSYTHLTLPTKRIV